MPLPKLNNNGELPPGEHLATLEEVNSVFGKSNKQRENLMAGLKTGSANLYAAGVKRIWINGSFITDKAEPNDIDGCWEYTSNVVLEKLDPVFLAESREPMKTKYGLEFFVANIIEADSGLPFPKFFQANREGDAKGIVVIDLGGLP